MAVCLFFTGCILVVDDTNRGDNDYYDSYNGSSYLIENAGWECWDDGTFDEWYFWVETDWYSYVHYVDIAIYSLYDSTVKEFRISNSYGSLFENYATYYAPQCGDPVDVEIIAVGESGANDIYTIFW